MLTRIPGMSMFTFRPGSYERKVDLGELFVTDTDGQVVLSTDGSEIESTKQSRSRLSSLVFSTLVVVSCAAVLVVDARVRPGSFESVAVAAGWYFHDLGVDRRLTRLHRDPGLRR